MIKKCLLFGALLASSLSIPNRAQQIKTVLSQEYAVALSEYKIENFTTEYSVFSPSGREVTTDGTFILNELGIYTIYKNGNAIKEINVLYEPFPVSISLCGEIVNEINTNVEITIPEAHLFSEKESFESYTINIEKDDIIVDSFEEISTSLVYSFAASGTYNVCYCVVDMFGFDIKKTYEVKVLSHNEIVNIDFPINWSVLSTIDFSKVHGLSEGISYPVEILLKDSTGSAIEIINNQYTFEKEDIYNVQFICDFNGVLVKEEITLNVELCEASYFSKGKNIISITKSENTEKNNGVEIKANGTDSSIYYNKSINLSKFDKTQEIVDFFVVCDDDSEMQDIRVSLIDAYDENNKISIYWRRSKSVGWEHLTYCLVEFNGYSAAICNETGVDYGKLREVYGAALVCSLKNNNLSPFNFTYSQEENALYTYRYDAGGNFIKLIDFDDKNLLGNYIPWNGFSSDNVYLKFDFINNVKSKIVINSIDGKDLTKTTKDIKDEEFLTFDYLDEKNVHKDDILINSYINYKTKLPKPSISKILRDNLNVNLDIYLDDRKVDEDIVDYEFIPKVSGNYKAVYSYTDIYGNNQEVSIDFVCKGESPSSFNIHLKDEDASISNISADYLTTFKVPEILVEGGIGNIKITSIFKENGTTEIYPNEYGELYLDFKGYVEISVLVSDDIGREETKNFLLNINSNIQSVVLSEEPKNFMAGRLINLPEFEAYDYSFDEKDEGYLLEKSVYLDGTLITGSSFVCPTDKEFVTLTFYGAKGKANEVKKDVVVKVIQCDNTNITLLDKIFDGVENAVSNQLFDDGYAIIMGSDLKIDYVNPLVSRTFNFKFALIDTMINFDSIVLNFTDYQNNDQVLCVELKNLTLDSIDVWLNGEMITTVEGSNGIYENGPFSGKQYSLYSINLLDYIKAFTTLDSNKILTYIVSYQNGRKYEGFDSGLFNFSFSTTNTGAESGLVIRQLSNQSFTSYSLFEGFDDQTPVIGTLTEFERTYSYLQEASIPIGVASDALQGKCDSIELTVTMPNGTTEQLDGTKENKIVFDEYGTYSFSYWTYDYYGNETKYDVYVNIIDKIKPVITVNDVINDSYKIGDEITLGNFEVTDNIGVVTKKVYICTPQSKLIEVDGCYSFVTKGKYKIIYYAADKVGNFEKIVYNVVVD